MVTFDSPSMTQHQEVTQEQGKQHENFPMQAIQKLTNVIDGHPIQPRKTSPSSTKSSMADPPHREYGIENMDNDNFKASMNISSGHMSRLIPRQPRSQKEFIDLTGDSDDEEESDQRVMSKLQNPQVQKVSRKRSREEEEEPSTKKNKKARTGQDKTGKKTGKKTQKPQGPRVLAEYKKKTRQSVTVPNGYQSDPESYTDRHGRPSAKYWAENRFPRQDVIIRPKPDDLQLPNPVPMDYIRPDLPPFGIGEKYGMVAYCESKHMYPPVDDMDCRLSLQQLGPVGQWDFKMWVTISKGRDDFCEDWHIDNARRAERSRKP